VATAAIKNASKMHAGGVLFSPGPTSSRPAHRLLSSQPAPIGARSAAPSTAAEDLKQQRREKQQADSYTVNWFDPAAGASKGRGQGQVAAQAQVKPAAQPGQAAAALKQRQESEKGLSYTQLMQEKLQQAAGPRPPKPMMPAAAAVAASAAKNGAVSLTDQHQVHDICERARLQPQPDPRCFRARHRQGPRPWPGPAAAPAAWA
jgi:hypothetical protein